MRPRPDTTVRRSSWSGIRRLVREPLVQFLVLGAMLFVAYGALRGDAAVTTSSHRIELTLDDLLQLETGFTSQWGRRPTGDEMVGLVESRIREDVLYREALALGLDKDDTIVKRRMAQKMEFVAEDAADAHEPTPDELRAWFAGNAARFTMPGRVTFRHLYFSPDRRGVRARDDAANAYEAVRGAAPDAAATKTLGDPFMFQDYLADRSPEQLAKEFGPPFARAVFAMPAGSWQAPVESGYGWHVVFVEASEPDRVPAFEEVEPDVRAAWLADRRAEASKAAYARMRAKYEVVFPAPATAGSAPDAASGTNPGS